MSETEYLPLKDYQVHNFTSSQQALYQYRVVFFLVKYYKQYILVQFFFKIQYSCSIFSLRFSIQVVFFSRLIYTPVNILSPIQPPTRPTGSAARATGASTTARTPSWATAAPASPTTPWPPTCAPASVSSTNRKIIYLVVSSLSLSLSLFLFSFFLSIYILVSLFLFHLLLCL